MIRVAAENLSYSLFSHQEEIRILPFHSEDSAVEHGVYIIRSAFYASDMISALFQQRKQTACHYGFSAAAAHRRYHQSSHAFSSKYSNFRSLRQLPCVDVSGLLFIIPVIPASNLSPSTSLR